LKTIKAIRGEGVRGTKKIAVGIRF
jgi:hypothetical protein